MNRDKVEPEVSGYPSKSRKVLDKYKKYASKATHKFPFVLDYTGESIGPFCQDVDSNIFLDFTSHGGAAPLGYNHPVIREKLDNFKVPEPSKVYGQSIYNYSDEVPAPIDLMERLVEVTGHDMDMVFMSNSGAEAVENSIKLCYDYTGGDYGITFQNAFHGRTLGALSLNRSNPKHRSKFPNIHKITDLPYCNNSSCQKKDCKCGFFREENSALRYKVENNMKPEEIAYLIIEPIQGEGGLNEPSQDFMKEVSEVSEEYNIPVISDEVQAGIGRTGEFWAIDHYNIKPDVISSAKGLRVGATISRKEIFPNEKSRISSTWGGGDIISSLVGYSTIDIIEDKNLMSNAKEKEKRIRDQLENTEEIEKITGKGLMLGIHLKSHEKKENLINNCINDGLLTLGCGDSTVRLLPPLDVRDREIDMACEIIKENI